LPKFGEYDTNHTFTHCLQEIFWSQSGIRNRGSYKDLKKMRYRYSPHAGKTFKYDYANDDQIRQVKKA